MYKGKADSEKYKNFTNARALERKAMQKKREITRLLN